MTRVRRTCAAVLFTGAMLGMSGVSWAQNASGIAGVVKDSSGGALPGVSVEASSPALIERTRSVVTDSEGRYNIVDLRPGTYTVTFTLTGFKTVTRDGIELPVGFTATVSPELPIGAVSENVTVSGAAPLVDVRSAAQGKVVPDETLNALPTASKSLLTIVSLTPGLNGAANVGGSAGIYGNSGNLGTFHGKSGYKVEIDGMSVLNANYLTGNVGVVPSGFAFTQVQLETGGASAESSVNGILTNTVPREGGNQWSGFAFGSGTGKALQSNNLNDDLAHRGLTSDSISKVIKLWDANFGIGGPIMHDRLWFFDSSRYSGNYNQWAGTFWNKTQGTPVYTPDLNDPGYRHENLEDTAVRLTWQASTRNKFAAYVNPQRYYVYGYTNSLTTAPETVGAWRFKPQAIYQLSWTSPVTNHLLIEAGSSTLLDNWRLFPSREGNSFEQIPLVDSSNGFAWNAPLPVLGGGGINLYDLTNRSDRWAQRFSMSYVTGAHTFKTGVQIEEGLNDVGTSVDHKIGFNGEFIPGDISMTFFKGVPSTITEYATPFVQNNRILDMGAYIQDRWNMGRLTLDYGFRFDMFRGWVPAQNVPADAFVAARSYPAQSCIPCWKDLDPRLSATYDVFGDSKTALKFAVGRYPQRHGAEIVFARNPIQTSINSVFRPWNDNFYGAGDPRSGNFSPDCDLTNPLLNGECGQISNLAFGQGNVVTNYSPDLNGWFKRDYFWDLSVELQRELRRGVSAYVGYYGNWWGNFTKTDNLLVTPQDYSPFSITAPVNPNLPGGGGYTITGLYDINPDKFGKTNNLVVLDPDHTQRNAYFATGTNVRVGRALLSGGLDIGQRVDDNCAITDSPGAARFCHQANAWKQGMQVKLNGSYPLPWNFTVAGIYQNTPALARTANYAAPNSIVAPSLGRNLASCGASNPCSLTTTVALIDPTALWETRRSQFDLRVTKSIKFGSRRDVRINFDAYNLFNANTVLAQNSTFGSLWRKPSQILDGRLLQFSGLFEF